MVNGVVYQFTFKEFSYLMFKKKMCPRCGGKLIKKKCCEITEGAKFHLKGGAVRHRLGNVKHYYYMFNCDNCGAEFELTELLEQNN